MSRRDCKVLINRSSTDIVLPLKSLTLIFLSEVCKEFGAIFHTNSVTLVCTSYIKYNLFVSYVCAICADVIDVEYYSQAEHL